MACISQGPEDGWSATIIGFAARRKARSDHYAREILKSEPQAPKEGEDTSSAFRDRAEMSCIRPDGGEKSYRGSKSMEEYPDGYAERVDSEEYCSRYRGRSARGQKVGKWTVRPGLFSKKKTGTCERLIESETAEVSACPRRIGCERLNDREEGCQRMIAASQSQRLQSGRLFSGFPGRHQQRGVGWLEMGFKISWGDRWWSLWDGNLAVATVEPDCLRLQNFPPSLLLNERRGPSA
nr:hypothetical protein CPAG_03359 [Coccidioides posadasii RMSCC 3488]